jgi:hypothetical protein
MADPETIYLASDTPLATFAHAHVWGIARLPGAATIASSPSN